MRESWATRPLGDVCEVIAGQSPAGSAYNSDGYGLPFYQGKKEFERKYLGPPTTWTTEITKRAKAIDILMSVRAPVGPINFATQEICIGRGLAAIRANVGLDQNFLFYFLLSIQSQISGRDGAVFPSISRNEICSIKLPIPSVAEQRRIVSILDEAFAGMATVTASAKANLKNASELFESYVAAAFENRSEGWVETTIGGLVERGVIFSPQDGNHGEIHPKKSDFVESGVPFIMASDLHDGTVDLAGCNFISIKTAKALRKGFAKDGDVLLSHKGTIGRTAILRTALEYIMLTPQVTYYRIKNDSALSAEYLRVFFECRKFREEMGHIAGGGSTRAYIGITKQLDLCFDLPTMAVQREIVEKFEAAERVKLELEASYNRKLELISELERSILKAAFSGELNSPRRALKEAAE